MDGFELNKIMGAILGTCLFTLSLNIVAGGMFAPHAPEKPGYHVEVPETPEAGSAQAATPEVEPIEVRLASASIERGEAAAKKCVACHTFAKGEPGKVGPNLYDVVAGPKAHAQGFAYSAAMKEAGGTWDVEALDHFIANPRGTVKGTTMAFAGIRRPEERADVIAYLNSLSDNPKPLPTAAPAAEKPADGGAEKPADGAASEKPAAAAAPEKPAAGAAPEKPAAGAAPGKPASGEPAKQ